MELKRISTLCVYIIISLLLLCYIRQTNAQRTILDKFINEYRALRGTLFKFIGRSDTDSAYIWNLKRQVTQYVLFEFFLSNQSIIHNTSNLF